MDRAQGCHASGTPALKFTMLSSDGSMGFSQFPGMQWSTGAVGRCGAVNLQTASAFLVNIATSGTMKSPVNTTLAPITPASTFQTQSFASRICV